MLASVIIPALNEADNIKRTVQAARGTYLLSDVEIIVVDGGSTDGTCDQVPSGEKIIRAHRGRANQMNAGAEAAQGALFVFCHADTLLPSGWLESVQKVLARPNVIGGAFQVTLFPERFIMVKIFNRINSPTLWLIMTGDNCQFMNREVFISLGGYLQIPLMEDIEMARRLRKAGWLARSPLRVTTSARRFEERGWIRQYLLNIYNTIRYAYLGVSAEKISASYRSSREDNLE